MTAIAIPPPGQPLDAVAERILEVLARGATLGDLFDLDEQDYDMLYRLGHRLYLQHRFADAVEVFGFLAVHRHRERRFLLAYAAALQMTRDHASAVALYTTAAMLDITDPAPCFHTCECLIAMGRRDEAAEGLEMVLRQCEGEPRHAQLRERAQALLELLAQPFASADQETTPCP